MKIVVTSGYSKSRHAIALIALLSRAGHDVGLCLNVRAFSVRRLRSYYRFYGPKLLSIARRRMLGGRSAGGLHPEVRYSEAFLKRNDIQQRGVSSVCRDTGTRMVNVVSLNDESTLRVLREYQPDVIVYAGGGILRKAFIESPRIGVLNAHGGPLPDIRGMNAAEWSLMCGIEPGTHMHFIDTGVDTGPLLFFVPLKFEPGDSVADIRGKATVQAIESHLRAVEMIEAGEHLPKPQKKEAGRQYFEMHPLLVDILDEWLRNNQLGNLRKVRSDGS